MMRLTRIKMTAKEYIQKPTAVSSIPVRMLDSTIFSDDCWCNEAHWFGSGQLIDQKMFDLAHAYLGRLPEYFPKQRTTQAWGGIEKGRLYRKMGEPEKAILTFHRVHEEFQGLKVYEALALLELADMYRESGKTDQAESYYRQVITRYRDNPEFVEKAETGLRRILQDKRKGG